MSILQLYHVKKTEHHCWTLKFHQSFHTNNQTIGHLTRIASHSNSQTSFIVVSRCQLVTSTSFWSCGLHHWHATMTRHPSPTTRICMTQLMVYLLVVFHGKVPPFHMMVHVLSSSRYGWKMNIPSGSTIHFYFSRICLRIQILLNLSTILPISSTTTRESIVMSISCLVIGHGNRWCVKFSPDYIY